MAGTKRRGILAKNYFILVFDNLLLHDSHFWQKIAHVNGTQNRRGLSFIRQAQNSPDEIKNFLLVN